MEEYSIYREIAERTEGDIYIGVVGPVRTGKSTFIKRFMDMLVIPNIENNYKRERAKDELPQSASGRTVMTTEPKFVPNEAVEVEVDGIQLKVRMIDCVGYLVDGALGYFEDNLPRMVSTPWHEHQIPFEEAAELGTQKVIREHSTIGLVVTTDGSITDIPRSSYIKAEERVINELREINKPFVILLNSVVPYGDDVEELKNELEEKYGVPVIPVNCAQLRMEDIGLIMEKILYEFPVKEVGVNMPRWVERLDNSYWLKENIIGAIKDVLKGIRNLREITDKVKNFKTCENISEAQLKEINLGRGSALIELDTPENLFYEVLSDISNVKVEGQHELIGLMKDYSRIKDQFDRVEYALNEVKYKGYGIVTPRMDELTLEEPEIVRQGNRFGVRLKASAPSIHLIRADIETEVSPIVGTEKQSEELVNFLLKEFENDPGKIWETNLFGKSLHELVNEGLHNKLYRMPEDAREKLQETLQRIINEGSGGLICIIL